MCANNGLYSWSSLRQSAQLPSLNLDLPFIYLTYCCCKILNIGQKFPPAYWAKSWVRPFNIPKTLNYTHEIICRYIVQCAAERGGVIVSNDNYRDLLAENPAWRETITKRLLMWTWCGDMIMFPIDPCGRGGPSLDAFLRF